MLVRGAASSFQAGDDLYSLRAHEGLDLANVTEYFGR